MTSPLFVFPTRNIHLVLDPADQIDLSICMDWPPRRVAMAWTDLSTLNGPIINASQHPAPGPVDVVPADALKRPTSPTGISFVPKAVGSAFYVVHVNKSALILSTVVRVAVHNKVTDLYLPYGEIPMFVGRSDIVLTVFARFDDGEAWDVSEHPYLEFKSDDPTVASVETGVGRITARARGETKVWVRVRGQPQDPYKYVVIRVSSIEDAVASGDIAAKYLQRPAKATRRLFLVSEGFVERDRFEQRADEIAERIFGEANTPFRWLKSHFDVIRIYVGSWGTRGIGFGPPIALGQMSPPIPNVNDRYLGSMLDEAHIVPDGHGLYDPAHLTGFGLMYGSRIGEPRGDIIDAATLVDIATTQRAWLSGMDVRSVGVDMRHVGPYRTPGAVHDPRASFLMSFNEMIGALGLQFDETDRVCFIIDDQMRGGAGFSVGGLELVPPQFVSMTTGVLATGELNLAGDAMFDGIEPRPQSPLALRVSERDYYDAGYVASSVVHELGHTYRLGDEYEDSSNDGVDPGDSKDQRFDIEEFDNVQLKVDALDLGQAAKPVVLEQVKWNVGRASKASVITAVRRVGPSTLMVRIDGNVHKVWKQFERVHVRTSYATPRALAANDVVDPKVVRIRDFEYEVNDIIGDELMLFAPNGGATDADLPDLHVLYVAIEDDTGPLHLIDRAVEAYLTAPNAPHGVFPRANAGCRADNAAANPPNVPAFPPMTVPSDLIGLYEGGAFFACGVLRPAGRCKMRSAGDLVRPPQPPYPFEVIEYCTVCKFIITDQIDPTQLPHVQPAYKKGH